ncbi:hypothetical protein [Bartonella sp. HY406]|uniref:hypothetical protein n=1 Tax=Bartonella sp. HY406 TaxID=2979331 RepID=UPI0021CA6766|nr:hypothetical protein [Bartonella sp. HY406]UXN03099.1 hypothetical protein N6B01_11600 [Bartonella sp. HY406]
MSKIFTPSEIMRAQRPQLFSDSVCTDAYRLSEAELSHHLDTLTDRNQHKDFEVFCRKLGERELCPNLRPQTGPEGGGDGKVDTETYPVDSSVSERWYVGDGISGSERWAFAFSAKKAWSDKVRSDVKGIVETQRGYNRIIFFTNRAARQRDRLRIEDELFSQYGVKVTIFDREWIIDRIFSHDHKDLAHKYLQAGEYQPDAIKLGPRDFERQQKLDELEVRLKKSSSTTQEQMQAVEDSLEAALLSRSLERPRYETDGRFKRAIDYAKKYGASYHHLNAVYEYAWAVFWWFDDIETMQDQYGKVETIAFASEQAGHIAKVFRLYQLLIGRVLRCHETAGEVLLIDRSKRLKAKLLELAADNSKPNNALHAETLLVLHRMWQILISKEKGNLDEIWGELCGIIDRAVGLGEFPADMIEEVVNAISESSPDSQMFDTLVEKTAEFMAERSREIKAGEMYLQQGKLKLNAEKAIEGIKWLGRSVVYLSKAECREEQAEALNHLAAAYGDVGLFWAARASALASIVQYLALSESEGCLRVEMISVLSLFVRLSLQLGHVLDVLSSIQFLHAIENITPLDEQSKKMLKNEFTNLDQLFACLIIIQSSVDIRRLESLPDILDCLALPLTRFALLYRLGYLDELKSDGSIPDGTEDHEIHEMMKLMASQLACSSFPYKIVILDNGFNNVSTKILGVMINVETSNTLEGFLQAETYATVFEAFAATLLSAKAFPLTEKLTVRVRQLDTIEEASVEVSDDFMMEVCVPTNWSLLEMNNLLIYNQHLVSFCIHALMNVAMLSDAAKTIEDLVKGENILERATLFCRAGIFRSRVFGTHVGRISDWSDYINRTFSGLSSEHTRPTTIELPPLTSENEEVIPQFVDEIRSHDDIIVRANVNPRLWDAAEWKGMVYGVMKLGHPPVVGLTFSNGQKGEAIFKNWRERFGNEDHNEEIYISVIRGIDQQNPFYYRVHITHNFDALPEKKGKMVVNTSRMNTMMVNDHKNLEMFCHHLNACGAYVLVPAILSEAGLYEFRMELGIIKRKFCLREAWQIGANDIDRIAIRPDDDVIIPKEENSPPIHELIKFREKQRDTKNN